MIIILIACLTSLAPEQCTVGPNIKWAVDIFFCPFPCKLTVIYDMNIFTMKSIAIDCQKICKSLVSDHFDLLKIPERS